MRSLQVLKVAEMDEAEWVHAIYDQLNFIEDRRLNALFHGQCYQKKMTGASNKKVK